MAIAFHRAEVESLDDKNYFVSSASSLSRSQSHPKFSYSHDSSAFYSHSDTSSMSDSPQTIVAPSPDLSYSSTPISSLSVSSDYDSDGDIQFSVADLDDFSFGTYNDDLFPVGGGLESPVMPKAANTYSVFQPDIDPPSTPSIPGTPFGEWAEDDSAVMMHPSRHVDYLSHEWKEEDVWASWKYIVARRGEVTNSARLENASWRSWCKAKNRLPTVSPETLNWLKDCDVTWLYGPLQTGASDLFRTHQELPRSPTSSFVTNKKPILKKRSLSEIMLLESLSASSLLKQATAAVQAQAQDGPRTMRPALHRAATADYISFPVSSRRTSDMTSLATSSTSSGIISPTSERKHIQFNEQVEQCIAVDIKGDEDDDGYNSDHYFDESDSSDGAIMMKRTRTKRGTPGRGATTKRRKSSSDSRIIAMLPSTTLKYREETPQPPVLAPAPVDTSIGSVLARSSSQETLRPAKPARRFWFGDDGDDEMDHYDDWQMPDFSGAPAFQDTSFLQATSPASNEEPIGMRRTPSGMFMPVDEEDQPPNDGLLGRVMEAVNTAKDIGHVIWNVGWSGR